MAECECLPNCPFFNDRMSGLPSTAQMLKDKYCLGDCSGCARHQVFLAAGSANVPADLFPGETARVAGILASFG